MSRTLIAVASLAILASSPASALLQGKKDNPVLSKPPLELRVDQASANIQDTVSSEASAATSESENRVESESEASGNWQPPL